MAFIRAIGRWTMTGLVINCIIGAGIFGLPAELTRLLGRASPIAMILAALLVAVIMACAAEVASQFSEPGGPYLYIRTAFGRFLGMQIGWIELLSVAVGLAALTSLFVDYFSASLPHPLGHWERACVAAIVIAVPAVANYRGVGCGARMSNLVTWAKLSPLVLLCLFGVVHFVRQPQMIKVTEIVAPGVSHWARAMVFLLFAFGGWEDSLVPAGEIHDPRRTIPRGLATGLMACALMYTLLQLTAVITVGLKPTDVPLQEAATVLLGRAGATLVTVGALISIYGWISAAMLYAPRLSYSLAAHGDFPAVFCRINPRYHTPSVAILFYALVGWVLAANGSFLSLVASSSGAFIVLYAFTCASLMRLRKLRPTADSFRVPFGSAMSIGGIAISLALLAGFRSRELLLIGLTALIATSNWLWTQRPRNHVEQKVGAAR